MNLSDAEKHALNDLLKGMLDPNLDERISLEEIICHKWCTEYKQSSKTEIIEEMVSRVKDLFLQNKLN